MKLSAVIGALLMAVPPLWAQPEDLPDLVVESITVGRDPSGPGQIVIRLADRLGREHFTRFFDWETERRRGEGLSIANDAIYPVDYVLRVDGTEIATAPTYLPRSGVKTVITDYRIPDDGRNHTVEVSARPRYAGFERDMSNNRLQAELMVPRFTVTIRLDELVVKDDCDDWSPGDWFVILHASNVAPTAGTTVSGAAIFPSREAAANLSTGDVVRPGTILELEGVPFGDALRITVAAFDCDSEVPRLALPLPFLDASLELLGCDDEEEIFEAPGAHDMVGNATARLGPDQWLDGTTVTISPFFDATHDCGPEREGARGDAYDVTLTVFAHPL